MAKQFLFTSESVSEGHPDKVADSISDSILDYMLQHDPMAHLACETLITRGHVTLAAEFRSDVLMQGELATADKIASIETAMRSIVKATIRSIGYDEQPYDIAVHLNAQSTDILQGVERDDNRLGAGDQGMMFGYACNETDALMPLPLSLAHSLVKRQSELRRSGAADWLRPDAKSQVTVLYRDDKPVYVTSVVFSTQHSPDIATDALRRRVYEEIILPCIPENLRSPELVCHINPTDRFELGGPDADTGLTGRKIIVDTYGGSCPHGGGAFSGKDPTKVDRSAAYMARYVAKNIVAAGLAKRCTLQLSYAIGLVEPISIHVDTHGTGSVADESLASVIPKVFDLTPAGIISTLDLRRPIYSKTSAYGHFGRTDADFTWEHTDRINELRQQVDLETKSN